MFSDQQLASTLVEKLSNPSVKLPTASHAVVKAKGPTQVLKSPPVQSACT